MKSPIKYILAAIIPALLITAALVFIWFTQEQKPDPASEKIIREAAAKILNKDPNDLTDVDFAQITEFSLDHITLSDIKLLEKFVNLRKLGLCPVRFPESAIPKWMKVLSRLGFIDLADRFSIDLSPLKKLLHLQSLQLADMPIKNIKPLSGLINLQQLLLFETQVSDFEPLRGLSNLQELWLNDTPVSDLKPLKGLTNLQVLHIKDCKNIKDEQVEDLQKALPNLRIER